MKPKLFLSVIIPAYNEEQRLPETLKSVVSYLSSQNYTSEIIVVDDGSKDETKNFTFSEYRHPQLKAKSRTDNLQVVTDDNTLKRVTSHNGNLTHSPIANIRILHHKVNQGKGAAVRTGALAAQGELTLMFDADNSTPIEEINKLLPAIKDSDIVIGSRHLPESNIQVKQPWHRRLLSRAANKLIQLALLPGIIDTQCGFKLFKTVVAKRIFSRATINRWGFDMEILFIAKKLGYSTKEVPVTWLNSPNSRVRPIKGALRTLKELGEIRVNGWRGVYQR